MHKSPFSSISVALLCALALGCGSAGEAPNDATPQGGSALGAAPDAQRPDRADGATRSRLAQRSDYRPSPVPAGPEPVREGFSTSVKPSTPTPGPTPTPEPTPEPATPAPSPVQPYTGPHNVAASKLVAVWGQEGGDKVIRENRPATTDGADSVHNSVWDGEKLDVFGAKNEVVNAAFVLEASAAGASDVSVSMSDLVGPDGFALRSPEVSGDEVFSWTNREVELFFVRYLQVKGLSKLTWENYDERHVPEGMRRPWSLPKGSGQGAWQDRPNHDKHYPDIAVPIEAVGSFAVAGNESQMLWTDIYVPHEAPAGVYHGVLEISEGSTVTWKVPVQLTVRNFALPDENHAKTMLYLGYGDVNERYLGVRWPGAGELGDKATVIRDRHFQLAHRHRISLIDNNEGPTSWNQDAPRPEWWPRLDGSLFTADHAYAGPGEGVGNDIFSIGTYGMWNWKGEGQAAMWQRTDNWENWFLENSPETERFLYLIDESPDIAQIEQWSAWMNANPGPGGDLMSFATTHFHHAIEAAPSLDIACSWFKVGSQTWEGAAQQYRNDPSRRLWLYNTGRPGSGSLATEDDGVSLRQLVWGQYKMKVDRWFIWEATYYNNFQGGTGDTNVFQQAHTFGGNSSVNSSIGETGWNYTNGDGVFMYPGTDTVYPEESYGLNGPLASLRLKYWRRGIQDYEYLYLAAQIDPAAVQQIVEDMIPAVLWEYGVDNENDPTYTHTDISWSTDPSDWEAARAALADIIESAQ